MRENTEARIPAEPTAAHGASIVREQKEIWLEGPSSNKWVVMDPHIVRQRDAGARDGAPEPAGQENTAEGGGVPPEDGEAEAEVGSASYKPSEEAQQAGRKAVELLGEARDGINEVVREHGVEVEQTAGLAESIDRLAAAVDALSRTVLALLAELRAGRSGGSLAVVAMVQKPVADGAVAEAETVASDGPVQKMLRAIKRALDRAGEWLWSMIIHLATIREWSLGGKVKVPGLAEASLTVTFGG